MATELEHASDVEDLVQRLYGAPLPEHAGVLHVVSTVRAPDGHLHVIRIGPDAPKSDTDFFVLNLCRARADAILTTGQILRTEPALHHDLSGPWRKALDAYRREVLGRSEPPWTAILTRGGDLSPEHPVFGDHTRKIVFAPPRAATRLRQTLAERARIVALDALDARSAAAFLEREGAHTISVEAGPSAVGALYVPSSAVDELLLSRCDASGLSPAVIGGALPQDDSLFSGLVRVASNIRSEQSGPWCFERWVRPGTAQLGAGTTPHLRA